MRKEELATEAQRAQRNARLGPFSVPSIASGNLRCALGGRKRIELHGDAIPEAARLASQDAPVSVPAALGALRGEEDAQPLAALQRHLADRAHPAQRQVAQCQAELRHLVGADRVIDAAAFDAGVDFLSWE